MKNDAKKIIVSDFDGTMTEQDFYSCVVDMILKPEDLQPWELFTQGKITHFEALRRIFACLHVKEEKLDEIMLAMRLDVRLKQSVEKLNQAGWKVVIVSNGCAWYLKKLLAKAGVEIEYHSNPGEYSESTGLQMREPTESPYYSAEVGISKAAVVRDYLAKGYQVAFSGDGRPDIEPALLVPENLRFAHGWLGEELQRRGEKFVSYGTWSEIADVLLNGKL